MTLREGGSYLRLPLPVANLARSKAFYEKALAPLGYVFVDEVPEPGTGIPIIGFGNDGDADFWIGGSPRSIFRRPLREELVAMSRAAVDAFHAAALAAGGKDTGAPAFHPMGNVKIYKASVTDPDGHTIDVVWFKPV